MTSKNLYFDTALSASYQFSVLREIGVTPDRLIFGSDFPYTERADSTASYAAGYTEPVKSGLFDDNQLLGIASENALSLFPRLAQEWKKARQPS